MTEGEPLLPDYPGVLGLVSEYDSPAYPGTVARRYLDEKASSGASRLARLEACAVKIGGALEHLLGEPCDITKKTWAEHIVFEADNRIGARFKVKFEASTERIVLSVILVNESHEQTWRLLCEAVGVIPRHQLLEQASARIGESNLAALGPLVHGWWDAGEPDAEILAVIRSWMRICTPLAFCSVMAELQMALNYFRVLIPEIDELAQSVTLKSHLAYPEYAASIEMLIRSAKEELAEFAYYERQRRSWGEST